MRTLIYKRTHTGDPDRNGWFGIYDCMGRVRTWEFDAVIGVGGMGAEPTTHGNNVRVLLHDLSDDEQREVERLLKLARHARRSRPRPAIGPGTKHLCRARRNSATGG